MALFVVLGAIMGKDFAELSGEAQSAIVDAVLDIDVPNLSESAKDEIRDWATPTAWRSIAVWPDTINVGNVVGKNESDDTHDSEEAAQAVCDLLEREGFGGNRETFPVSTRVEPVMG